MNDKPKSDKSAEIWERSNAQRRLSEQRHQHRLIELEKRTNSNRDLAEAREHRRAELRIGSEVAKTEGNLGVIQKTADLAPFYSDLEFDDYVRRENQRLRSLLVELEIRDTFSERHGLRLLQEVDATTKQELTFRADTNTERVKERGHEINLINAKGEDERKTLAFQADLENKLDKMSVEQIASVIQKIELILDTPEETMNNPEFDAPENDGEGSPKPQDSRDNEQEGVSETPDPLPTPEDEFMQTGKTDLPPVADHEFPEENAPEMPEATIIPIKRDPQDIDPKQDT